MPQYSSFTARQTHTGDKPVASIRDLAGDLDSGPLQLLDRCVDVVAHQVNLRHGLTVGRMHGELSRRQREDEPALLGDVLDAPPTEEDERT
jgi:hypothetical protein